MSIRIGASVCQERAVSVVPRGARTGRAPSMSGLLSVATGPALRQARYRDGSEQPAADGLGGRDEPPGPDELNGGRDVGGGVAIRARPRDQNRRASGGGR